MSRIESHNGQPGSPPPGVEPDGGGRLWWKATALAPIALLVVVALPSTWAVALGAGLCAALLTPVAFAFVAPMYKANPKARATALAVVFTAVFLLSGGRLYLYGAGGTLELVAPEKYGAMAHDSQDVIRLNVTFVNAGESILRFNPGDYYQVYPPQLFLITSNGTELRLSIPPPLAPPPLLLPEKFVELAPHQQQPASTTFSVRDLGRLNATSPVQPGNYTLFWTYQEHRLGNSGLPCWTGEIRSANATLEIF